MPKMRIYSTESGLKMQISMHTVKQKKKLKWNDNDDQRKTKTKKKTARKKEENSTLNTIYFHFRVLRLRKCVSLAFNFQLLTFYSALLSRFVRFGRCYMHVLCVLCYAYVDASPFRLFFFFFLKCKSFSFFTIHLKFIQQYNNNNPNRKGKQQK